MLTKSKEFHEFIKENSKHPLLKRKGIPECLTFITFRITKYPLILEAILKCSLDIDGERDNLERALCKAKVRFLF